MKEKYDSRASINLGLYELSEIFDGRQVEALFLWFVFMNQLDMAKYLCSRSRVRFSVYRIASERVSLLR